MAGNLSDPEWKTILPRIHDGKCTAFLGAGVNDGILPLGKDIAKGWATEYEYPLGDCDNLVRVAQFMAVTTDPMCPKERVLELITSQLDAWRQLGKDKEQLTARDQPLSVLADLPIPIYITTNYDDLMMSALKIEGRSKDPHREVCCWNKYVRNKLEEQKKASIFESQPSFVPTPRSPIVFHLHGHDELPESLVISEDDYLEFMVNMTRDPKLLPSVVEGAIASTSLLFIGYSLADWNFKVLWKLLKSVSTIGKRISVAVQLPPGESEEVEKQVDLRKQEIVEAYLRRYFENMDVKVYWGTAREFSKELRDRWEKFHGR